MKIYLLKLLIAMTISFTMTIISNIIHIISVSYLLGCIATGMIIISLVIIDNKYGKWKIKIEYIEIEKDENGNTTGIA